MASRFLRQSIATILALGALWSTDAFATCGGRGEPPCTLDPVEVTGPRPPDYIPDPPSFNPPDESPPNDEGGGGGPGGGYPGDPQCPEQPGGNSLIPSLKSVSCPALTCEDLLPNKPCHNPVPAPSIFDWSVGRDSLRAGSPIARLMALADPTTETGRQLTPATRGMIQRGILRFSSADPFVTLDEIRLRLSSEIREACQAQRNAETWMNNGWETCADVAVEIHRETIQDSGILRTILDELSQQGISISALSYGPLGWEPGSNSLAAHRANLDGQRACAWWWEQVKKLNCGG